MAATPRPDAAPRAREHTSLSIAAALTRSLGLLLRGRVRFPRDDVGRTLTMEDGARFTIFRHAMVKAEGEPAAAFVVRFTPAHMSVRQNIRFSLLPMLPLLGQRGFREKYWCVDEQSGMCQGVYAWQTVTDAEVYAGSVALRFMTGRSLPGSVSHRIVDQAAERYWPFQDAGSRGGRRQLRSAEKLRKRTVASRLVDRGFALLTRLGWGARYRHVLVVRGRKTGRLYSTPVDAIEYGGSRWLVAGYGRPAWAANVRAAGEVTLSRGGRTVRYRATEVDAEAAVPVLRTYIDQIRVTRPYFDASPDSDDATVAAELPRHPVFRLTAY